MKSLAENMNLAVPESKREYYPSLRITSKTFPNLDKSKVGDKVKLSIEAVIVSLTKRENNPTEIRLELRKGEIEGEK